MGAASDDARVNRTLVIATAKPCVRVLSEQPQKCRAALERRCVIDRRQTGQGERRVEIIVERIAH